MRLITALACGLTACVAPSTAPAVDDGTTAAAGSTPWFIGSGGVFALVEDYDYPWLAGLQYRARPRTGWSLMPGAGFAVGPDGMAYFYADIAHDFALPQRWFLTLSLAGGAFVNGEPIGTGYPLEFQSGIAVSRQLAGGARVGLAGYHISNAGLDSPNNGTEALVLFLARPVRDRR